MNRTNPTFILSFLFVFSTFAQTETSYLDKKGKKHLCGPFEIETLKNDSTFSEWYAKNYSSYEVLLGDATWKKNLNNTTVDIYIGTWCGDSRTWVPRFVKLWEELGLDKSQLNFIALYNSTDKYKQGPNGEELGKKIHRVPTFIFNEGDKEIGRIVESPHTSLETDLAQIALGYPSAPNYKGADYLLDIIESNPLDSIYAHSRYYLNTVYRKIHGSSELNSLGYVLLRSNRLKEAELVFVMNARCFSKEANVYDSYGEVLAKLGRTEEAIKQYEKVLTFIPDDKNALAQLEILREKK